MFRLTCDIIFIHVLLFFISRVNILSEKAISQTPSHFLSLTISFSALNSPVRLHLVCPSVAGEPKIILKKARKKKQVSPHSPAVKSVKLNQPSENVCNQDCDTLSLKHLSILLRNWKELWAERGREEGGYQ